MDQRANRKKRAILVFESERSEAEKLKNHLVQGGYQTYTSVSLNEALKIVDEKSIAVALVALRQPELDPEQVIERLQRVKDHGPIPVIAILDSFSEDHAAEVLEAGAADFLVRPLDFQELTRRIAVWARLSESRVKDHGDETCLLREQEPPSSRQSPWGRILGGLTGFFNSCYDDDKILGQQYEQLVRLGLGSFGEVWKVRKITQEPPNIFVAKIPLSKKLNPKIEKEARILRMLADDPAVPKVHEVIKAKKKSILIQEFVAGKTLLEVIERELEEEEAESVLIQLVDVVAHAHDLRIIHRDIKPENVIVKPDGTIKLLDFGASKELREKEVSDTVTGSRPYMSPEQIMGQSQRRSDVWALGVVMYVLYTGTFPYYHEVEKVLMDMILELPVPRPRKHNEDLDPEIERIILKCLEKNSEDRFANAGALKNAIINAFPGFGNRILPLY